jgi:hypothetical protein
MALAGDHAFDQRVADGAFKGILHQDIVPLAAVCFFAPRSREKALMRGW